MGRLSAVLVSTEDILPTVDKSRGEKTAGSRYLQLDT